MIPKKIFINTFLFLIILSSFGFFSYQGFAQERALEVKYPEILGIKPETVKIGVVEYAKYIFNFIIAIVGLIAFGALIWGGVSYLISVGKPEELEKAKKQILAAFLGILILLFSYLILTTINPQLVIFQISQLEKPKFLKPTLPPDKPPDAPTSLARISELAQNLITIVEGIKYYGQELKNLLQRCSCAQSNTRSMCLCQDYRGSCQPLYCYIARDAFPCPNWERIKEYQQKIIAFKDEILYYKNRIEAEREDLIFETEQLQKKVNYYKKTIQVEEEVLAQIPAEEKITRENQEKLISNLKDIKEKLELELNIRLTVLDNLYVLVSSINNLSNLIKKLAEPPDSLMDSCWQRVKDVCRAGCIGGCHDTPGCFPINCLGGNPCKIAEIQSNINQIIQIADQIIQISENIFSSTKIPPTCEGAGGICVEKGQSCPTGYKSSTQLSCKEAEKQCCLPEEAVSCQCSVPPYNGCVDLATLGIPIKSSNTRYTDPTLAQKLVIFKNCLSQKGIFGWRVTEACPPTQDHKSACHRIDGKCLDANANILCKNQSATEECIRQAGLGAYNECACPGVAPHYHIDLRGSIRYCR